MKNSSNAFFICFTMRNPNNQTLASPARHPNSSFSASLSRRLSLKSSSRRKSSSSETAEPSSPKVTCIGQVKIKSKKKRTSNNNQHLVNRSRSGRETNSFRQREVKAISICDALSCFMPALCGSWKSCYRDSNGGSKKEQRKCGGDRRRKRYSLSVFIRWLMAVDEEEVEDKKVRNLNDFGEIGCFVREREEEDDLEYAFSRKKEEEFEEEEEVPVNICNPPKNALLLMRCRSDPVRMAALSTKFWDSPAMKVDCKNEEDVEVEVKEAHFVEEKVEKIEEDKNVVAEDEVVETKVLEKTTKNNNVVAVEKMLKEEEDEREEGEIVLRRSISCSTSNSIELSKLKGGEKRRSFSYREKEKRRNSFSAEKESTRSSFCSKKEARRSSFSSNNSKESKTRWSISFEKENLGLKDKPLTLQSSEEAKTEETPPLKEDLVKSVDQPNTGSCNGEETHTVEKEKKPRELPKCLLLMMYEPKLSMEVSKETWVCNTDFVHQRWNQDPEPKHERTEEEESMKVEDKHAENKNKTAIVRQTPSEQQSLISPMEQKLLKSLAVSALPQARHLVLTRCKSEPGKSSARLVADMCFWKARHQPIGTAGLGF